MKQDLEQGLMITVFVFIMMLLVDYLTVLTKGEIDRIIKGGQARQYLIASFLGSSPGCLGSFMNVSFYVHGLISFGAIAGGMIATSGDEAFVMLGMFPEKAVLLFGMLFIIGFLSSYLIDRLVVFLRIKSCQECQFAGVHADDECRCFALREVFHHLKNPSLVRFLLLVLLIGTFSFLVKGVVGPESWNWQKWTLILLLLLTCFIIVTVPEHYLEEHVWEHIARKHLWKVFLWSSGALLLVDSCQNIFDLESLLNAHMRWVLILAAVTAVIPESGPHLVFVMMFAKGLVPFSVLLTSSIVQDGHGMLPLLSYTVKDSILIKSFNFIIGLFIGIIMFSLGH